MNSITGYFFAPGLGYNDALHVVRANGSTEIYATGPYIAEALEEMGQSSVPQVPNPYGDSE